MKSSLAYFNVAALPEADGAPPSEFRLLAKGVNPYLKEGMDEPSTFMFDDESAAEVIDRFKKSGRDRMAIDYDHATFNDSVPEKKAAGWFVPAIRNGELWATDVKWTPRAAEYLRNKEYRFHSPTLELDDDGRVTALRPVALTNDPALCNLKPLVAANRSHKAPKMKLVLKALDLTEEADESATLAAVEQLKDVRAQMLSLSGKSTVAEALGALHAMKQSAEQVTALSAEVTKLRAEKLANEIDSMVDAAVKDGRLAPAKRDEMVQLSSKIGVDGLKVFLSMLPTQPAQSAPAIAPASDPKPAVQLTADELNIAKAIGVTAEAFAAMKSQRTTTFPVASVSSL